MDPTSESTRLARVPQVRVPRLRVPWLTSVTRVLEQRRWARFSLVFLLILLLKWDTLLQPPVWDTAMGLFPPALTLADNGFDLLELLAMPGYEDGGPNVASTSLVTLGTAAVLWATGGGTGAFLILHLLHFAVAAVALLTLFHYIGGSGSDRINGNGSECHS